MASESLTPPPSGGGYAKYLIVLLLLVGGGLGAYFATRKDPEPPKAAPPVQNAERSTALTPDTIEIPSEEPVEEDAAVAEPTPVKKPRAAAGDPWECAGDVPAAALRGALAEGSSAIRSCYERQLRNDNQLQGEVRLQVRIGNDGKVTHTRVTGNMRDATVKSCMQGVAKSWSFPAPAGGSCAVFDAPFKFTPKQ
jgi:outer membrane biosynthesis protein TonB